MVPPPPLAEGPFSITKNCRNKQRGVTDIARIVSGSLSVDDPAKKLVKRQHNTEEDSSEKRNMYYIRSSPPSFRHEYSQQENSVYKPPHVGSLSVARSLGCYLGTTTRDVPLRYGRYQVLK